MHLDCNISVKPSHIGLDIGTNLVKNNMDLLIDKANTTIPIPPNHCSNALHKSIPFGKLSRPIITVEPVVVTPLIDSKNEFVKVS